MDNKHGWNVAEMKILVIFGLSIYIFPFIACLVYIQDSHFCCVSDVHWVSITPSFFHWTIYSLQTAKYDVKALTNLSELWSEKGNLEKLDLEHLCQQNIWHLSSQSHG